MSQRSLDVLRSLASKLGGRGLTWQQALSAVAIERVVDPVALAAARADLGDAWARQVYEVTAAEVPGFEELCFDDTEPGALPYMTVNQFLITVAAMRESDPDIGRMRLVFGRDRQDVALVAVTSLRESPAGDADYALLVDTLRTSPPAAG